MLMLLSLIILITRDSVNANNALCSLPPCACCQPASLELQQEEKVVSIFFVLYYL